MFTGLFTGVYVYIDIFVSSYLNIVGSIPSSLCNIDSLTYLSVSQNSTCYHPCFGNTTNIDLVSNLITCPTTQENAICAIVAATNIVSIAGYDEWNCDASGYPATEPCAVDNAWSGLTCDVETLTVVAINFRNSSVVGTLPESLGNLGELSFLDLGYNSLYGNTSN